MKRVVGVAILFCFLALPGNAWGQKCNIYIDPLTYKPKINYGDSLHVARAVLSRVEGDFPRPLKWVIEIAIFPQQNKYSWQRIKVDVDPPCVEISCQAGFRF